jgi:hypothetical protein
MMGASRQLGAFPKVHWVSDGYHADRDQTQKRKKKSP